MVATRALTHDRVSSVLNGTTVNGNDLNDCTISHSSGDRVKQYLSLVHSKGEFVVKAVRHDSLRIDRFT